MNAIVISLFGQSRHLVEAPVLVAQVGALNQDFFDSIRDNISEQIEMPVVLEFSVIPETIVRSSDVVTPGGIL